MIKSANDLNKNLASISTCAFEEKINYNLDSTKQAQEVIFSQKILKYQLLRFEFES